MDKKSKEALRRYKKSRQQTHSSSESSSSSDSESSSSSYSSDSGERKALERHRRKKAKLAAAVAAGALHQNCSSSSSDHERRKREKRDHCQKLLEAKREHIKRKLREAKLKKRAAAAAVLSGHHRSLSPGTQAKLKKLAERKHLRAIEKERREREKQKHRAAVREKDREHHRGSRSPKITKIRIHQDVKRQKTPPQRAHHPLMSSREKIIIQTRTRERTPSIERERRRHEHDIRDRERRDRDRERAEREAARDKERAEALARCQERQRERERIAREKLRREEEEKKYGSSYASERERERMLSRGADRDLALPPRYGSRERSLEAVERARHSTKRGLEYERGDRDYLEAERRGLLDRDELRREREYIATHRRDISPVDHYNPRLRDHREIYPEDERDRAYNRSYMGEGRHPREPWIDPRELRERGLHDLRDPRDLREMDHDMMMYPEDRLLRERERRGDWKGDWDVGRERDWDEATGSARGGFVGGPKRGSIGGSSVGPSKGTPREPSVEPDWDIEEGQEVPGTPSSLKKGESATLRESGGFTSGPREPWMEKDHRERRWPSEWREGDEDSPRTGNPAGPSLLHHRSERGRGSFRRGMGERSTPGSFRQHPPALMTLPVQAPGSYHGGTPTRFPNKRSMTYTNPNLIKKQQAALVAAKAAAHSSAVAAATTAVAAAMAAAQSTATATTSPGIIGQASSKPSTPTVEEKPEAGEILADTDSNSKTDVEVVARAEVAALTDKPGGELSEISDSDDDILSKGEKRAKTDSEDTAAEPTDSLTEPVVEVDKTVSSPKKEDPPANEEKTVEEDEMLDFEEISDGELEEDARHKFGVGDALGVDWASLIEETKRQAATTAPNASDQFTTAKQKWQPHRLILDVGISMRMAGEYYAKKLLSEAQQKLNEELAQLQNIKKEIKEEVSSQVDEDSMNVPMDADENTNDVDEKRADFQLPAKSLEDLQVTTFNVDQVHPIANVQVAERKQRLEQQTLIPNACGPNSRALSARQDLKLRRQLCGLPAHDFNLPKKLPAVSAKLKQMAVAAFQRAMEVK